MVTETTMHKLPGGGLMNQEAHIIWEDKITDITIGIVKALCKPEWGEDWSNHVPWTE